MRGLLFLLPALLSAQVSPPKSGTAAPRAVHAGASAISKPVTVKPALATDDEKTIYSLGLAMYRSLSQFDLSPSELELVKRGITDAATGKAAVDLQTWGPKIQPLAEARHGRVIEREKADSAAYIAKAAAEPGAIRTESGIVYRDVRVGNGASPKATDKVKVNYRGTLVNGTEFDSSYSRNQPAEFALNGVIRCWTEGVQRMKVGGEAILVCPSDLAYGDRGQGSIPGGAVLIFHIELLEIAAGNP
jgi:FKBP-type peptidyl-prolyl cis-trans isomerase FkpA